MLPRADFYTTSSQFDPLKNSREHMYYHHPDLDPALDRWKKDTLVLVRKTSGQDYLIRFLENGYEIPADAETFSQVQRWKFRARFDVAQEFAAEEQKSRTITRSLKKLVLARQDNRCAFCGEEFSKDNKCEIDHIFEWSSGGLTELSNLQALCTESCHWIKTLAFRKAKLNGKIDPAHWDLNDQKYNFLDDLMKKIRSHDDLRTNVPNDRVLSA